MKSHSFSGTERIQLDRQTLRANNNTAAQINAYKWSVQITAPTTNTRYSVKSDSVLVLLQAQTCGNFTFALFCENSESSPSAQFADSTDFVGVSVPTLELPLFPPCNISRG